MGKTITCLLHAETDERGNLYKTAKGKLEDMTERIKPFVTSSTIWLHDGARPAINTILCLAPHFDIQVSKKDLEEDIQAAECGKQGKAPRQVEWLPILDPDNILGPRRAELESARDQIFAKLTKNDSVLACMREQYFRSFFDFVGGTPYAGQLACGDAVVLQFVENGKALVLANTKRITI
jgi:hypothetical protein